MKTDPEKARAWQRRGVENYQRNRAAAVPRRRKSRAKPRRNDGPWRDECIALYGDWCRACGAHGCQMDHMWPRGQGGRSDVRNGLPLCPTHHEQKTLGKLQIRPEWLTVEQIEYLAEVRWVAWDEQGQPYGRGYKHFTARVAA